MKLFQFKLAARTDAAGKYSPTAPLEGNEDNMFVDKDLSNEQQGAFTADEIVDLSDKGCLMVVADGMGGMNAGEVASAIAIQTVMDYFKSDKLTDSVLRDTKTRIRYLENVVVAADAAIKVDASQNPDHEGMGSTIILAWLCKGEVCLTWCGDSRAYLFRPSVGLKQVSKDHSYVQDLIDAGKITEVEAFDHPYSNIITRSLGDPEKKAKPESLSFPVYRGDIIMLCSDGLSGVLRDHKTFVDGQRVDSENLEDIIRENRSSLAECRDFLFDAAQRNEWYDNVTAILCEIVEGEVLPEDLESPFKPAAEGTSNPSSSTVKKSHITISKKTLPFIIGIALILLGLIVFIGWKFLYPKPISDAERWAKCKEYGSLKMFDEYLRDFPNGEFADSAKYWIDSLEKQPEQKKIEENNADISHIGSSSSKTNTQKAEDNKAKNMLHDSIKTDSMKIGKLTLIPQELTPIIENQEPIEKQEPQKDSNTQPDKRLKPKKVDSNTQSKEQIAYEKATKLDANLDDIIDYLEHYKSKSERRQAVLNSFNMVYFGKLKKIKTMPELEAFEKAHDSIMKKVGLDEKSETNKNAKRQIQKKKEKLQEG